MTPFSTKVCAYKHMCTHFMGDFPGASRGHSFKPTKGTEVPSSGTALHNMAPAIARCGQEDSDPRFLACISIWIHVPPPLGSSTRLPSSSFTSLIGAYTEQVPGECFLGACAGLDPLQHPLWVTVCFIPFILLHRSHTIARPVLLNGFGKSICNMQVKTISNRNSKHLLCAVLYTLCIRNH